MKSPAEIVFDWIRGHYSRQVFLAAVTGTSGNKVLVQRQGQGSADTTAYPKLAAYTSPVVGDQVLCVTAGETPIVLGKIST